MGLIEEIWDELWIVSKKRETITYSELCKRLNEKGIKMSSRFLTPHLTKISEKCIDNGKPIFAALVVREDKRIPGDGYFALQKIHRSSNLSDVDTWKKECEDVWSEWC